MNPKSLFDSPPHEYVALHQQGKRVGSGGTALAIMRADAGFAARKKGMKSGRWRSLNGFEMVFFHQEKTN